MSERVFECRRCGTLCIAYGRGCNRVAWCSDECRAADQEESHVG